MRGESGIVAMIFSACAFLLLAQTGIAQTQAEQRQRRELRIQTRDEMRTIRNDDSLSREEKRTRLGSLRKARNERRQERREIGRQRRAEDLGLTGEQQKQLRDLRTATRDQERTVRSDDSLSREERRARLRGLRESGRTEAGEILTTEQQGKIRDRREQRQQGRGGNRGIGPSRPEGSARGRRGPDYRRGTRGTLRRGLELPSPPQRRGGRGGGRRR